MTGQPFLHDLVVCVQAPTMALSGVDGQIRAAGVQGVLHNDIRVLSRAELRVDGVEPVPLSGGPAAGSAARFVGVLRSLGDAGSEPAVRVVRHRQVRAGAVHEEIRVVSTAPGPVRADVHLVLAADLAPIEQVKAGVQVTAGPWEAAGTGTEGSSWTAAGSAGGTGWATSSVTATAGTSATASTSATVTSGATATWSARAGTGRPGGAGTEIRWVGRGAEVRVVAPEAVLDATGGEPWLRWRLDLAGPGERVFGWELTVRDRGAVVAGSTGEPEWARPRVLAADPRLAALLGRSLDDLAGLRLTVPGAPDQLFLGAGVPWYLTLFGRDSLWAARMLLPLGTTLAGGTLRALAARQGSRTDPASAQEPGKIPHELRREGDHVWQGGASGSDAAHGAMPLRLPPLYYGTVDATPLWIILLHDAWHWGLPPAEVAALLPALEAALGWLAATAARDPDGFLTYRDRSGHGLANQGWKDSPDALRYADGSLAVPPVALCEVQGYAYEAARCGAALLDAFGRDGAEGWRQWADRLAVAFRQRFWVAGDYPAVALDAACRPVDTLTSNIGHLLGTGLLDAAETGRVAARLATLDSGYGLPTLSASASSYDPLSYHRGSVWPHDTAIALLGLCRSGHGDRAAPLAAGLLRAGERFGYRLPELYAGDAEDPVPYPAACRPQAWSAAAGVAVLTALLGLVADVPNGRIAVRPLRPLPTGALSVQGLVAGGHRIGIGVDAAGEVTDLDAGGLAVDSGR